METMAWLGIVSLAFLLGLVFYTFHKLWKKYAVIYGEVCGKKFLEGWSDRRPGHICYVGGSIMRDDVWLTEIHPPEWRVKLRIPSMGKTVVREYQIPEEMFYGVKEGDFLTVKRCNRR